MIEALITNYKIEKKPVIEKPAQKKHIQMDLFSMIEQKESTQHLGFGLDFSTEK